MSKAAIPTTKNRPKLSVIVLANDEGRLLHHTLVGVVRALQYAGAQNYKCEYLVVPISENTGTAAYLKTAQSKLELPFQLVSLKPKPHNDPGRAINNAIQQAKGSFISLVPGGDVVAKDWFSLALQKIEKLTAEKVVTHPEYYLTFADKDRLQHLMSSTDKQFDGRVLLDENYFGGHVLASAGLMQKFQFQVNSTNMDIDKLAWQWNCDTLTAGIEHITVSKTMVAHRHQHQSETMTQLPPISSYFKTIPKRLEAKDKPTLTLSTTDRRLEKLRLIVSKIHHLRPVHVLRKRHHRINEYLVSLYNETLHFLRPVSSNPRPKIPLWLEAATLDLHEIDHRIFLSNHLKQIIEHYQPMPSQFSKLYWQTATQLPRHIDILLVVNYIKNGGAELELKYLLTEVRHSNPQATIAVIATEPSDSPWISELGKLQFVDMGVESSSLPPTEQGRLVATLCLQLHPRVLHIMNSTAGYYALSRYSKQIKTVSKLFITIFSIDRTPEGRKTHLFTEHMVEAADDLTKVFTDNQALVNQLVNLMALTPELFSVHYQPANLNQMVNETIVAKKFTHKKVRILWAGRMDRQKRPDILAALAGRLKTEKLPVELHVYGSSAFYDDSYQRQIEENKNLTYHGPYSNGLANLDLKSFDIFLMTSQWEGMPNVLIEAILGGLLVIAPNVGGVGELIEDGITGYLIKSYDDIAEYIKAIKSVIEDPEKSRKQTLQAQAKLKRRHSIDAYQKQIAKEKVYLGKVNNDS